MTLEQHLATSHVSLEHFVLGKAREERGEYEPQPKRWTRAEYDAVVETGILEGQRVELIDGEIIEMSPQSEIHYAAIHRVMRVLNRIFGEGYWVRPQGPLGLGKYSEPEPDLAVVRGDIGDFSQHPTRALLAVEVSLTTLQFDRKQKTLLYAQAGIDDFWIVNLVENQLEVYRQPSAEGYRERTVLSPNDSIAPLAAPHATIPVKDLLP